MPLLYNHNISGPINRRTKPLNKTKIIVKGDYMLTVILWVGLLGLVFFALQQEGNL